MAACTGLHRRQHGPRAGHADDAGHGSTESPFPRQYPAGRIRFGQFPDATLNGKPVRLGPGARILNQDNLIVPPIAVHGKSYVVGYVADTMGMIMTVWILSEEEYRALRKQHGR